MRRVRYSVAASLDGYIAGPGGEYDWIPMDPDIDMEALFADFDTLLIGRKTYEMMVEQGKGTADLFGLQAFVFSTTLRQEDHPSVTIVSGDPCPTIAALREAPGKDLWLFGGGVLFQTMLDAGLVDAVEIAVIPILLGGGIPFLPAAASRTKLELTEHQAYPKSGTLLLQYKVRHG